MMLAYVLDDRDLAFLVLDNESHDYDAQLTAIRDLSSLHRRHARSFVDRTREVEESIAHSTGLSVERAVDEVIDRYQRSVYLDAAQSMAAVGMLAPFLESLFAHAFDGIGRLAASNAVEFPVHPRWTMNSKKRWDCHFGGKGSRGIVAGILDLVDAVGLEADLPPDLAVTLAALFRYRNAMSHHGMEWPPAERDDFAAAKEVWPNDWFSMAVSDGRPWVYYATERFVDHVLEVIELTLVGLGRFVRRTFLHGTTGSP